MPKFEVLVTDVDPAFEVHKAGCRDVARRKRQSMGCSSYTSSAATPQDLVAYEAREYQAQEMDWTESDFRIMPCCGGAQ